VLAKLGTWLAFFWARSQNPFWIFKGNQMRIWSKFIFAVALSLQALTVVAAGADEIKTLEFMKQTFSEVDIKRISYISHQMALDETTAAKFWPRYQDYLHKQISLRDKQLATLAAFTSHLNQDDLPAKAASKLLSESMAQEKIRLDNRQQFIRQLSGVLNPQQKLRLYQLELLLDAQVRSRILSQIPLATSPGE
jgi:Spy/CpxP family protein refolding chaperone